MKKEPSIFMVILITFMCCFITTLINVTQSTDIRILGNIIGIFIIVFITKGLMKLLKSANFFKMVFIQVLMLVLMFSIINIIVFCHIPESYSIVLEDYSKDIRGAVLISIDMFDYTLSNTLFGCSYISPISAFTRCIHSMQILICYFYIAWMAGTYKKN